MKKLSVILGCALGLYLVWWSPPLPDPDVEITRRGDESLVVARASSDSELYVSSARPDLATIREARVAFGEDPFATMELEGQIQGFTYITRFGLDGARFEIDMHYLGEESTTQLFVNVMRPPRPPIPLLNATLRNLLAGLLIATILLAGRERLRRRSSREAVPRASVEP